MQAAIALIPLVLSALPTSRALTAQGQKEPALSTRALLDRANEIRRRTSPTRPPAADHDALSFPSAYSYDSGGATMTRGFCNWLIPGSLMVGQYPSCNPERRRSPRADEAERHVRSVVVDGGISLFCCLQSEVPAQDDDEAWENAGGEILLPFHLRDEFPGSFGHYAPLVRTASELASSSLSAEPRPEPAFVHAPIEDLSVPDSSPFRRLLSDLIRAMGEEGRAVYLHCWGGRGRAGLLGGCLLSLVYPEMDPEQVLAIVQRGYESRAGSGDMHPALRRSPQTSQQRDFVRQFVKEVMREQRTNK